MNELEIGELYLFYSGKYPFRVLLLNRTEIRSISNGDYMIYLGTKPMCSYNFYIFLTKHGLITESTGCINHMLKGLSEYGTLK